MRTQRFSLRQTRRLVNSTGKRISHEGLLLLREMAESMIIYAADKAGRKTRRITLQKRHIKDAIDGELFLKLYTIALDWHTGKPTVTPSSNKNYKPKEKPIPVAFALNDYEKRRRLDFQSIRI